jgi:DNA modification methylase
MANSIVIDPEFRALVPPFAKEEYEQLERNLVADGCRDPLVVWDGILLDGHNRYEICKRHNLKYRQEEVLLANRDAAAVWIIDNQCGRRNIALIDKVQLTERKRGILEAQAKTRMLAGCHPPINLSEGSKGEVRNQLAAQVGVSGMTYDALAAVVESGAEELKQAVREKTVGASTAAEIATLPKTKQREIVAKGEKEILAKAREIKKDRATKRVQERVEKAAAVLESNHPLKGADFQLIVGDILHAGSQISDASIDAIITDPPYPKEFVPEYAKLAEFANRVLKPGGRCLIMVGQANLYEILQELMPRLSYQWMLGYYSPGQSTQVFGRRVKSNWKPVLYFVKGKNSWEHVDDVVHSDRNDKRFHKWGQSVGGMAQIVGRFTVAGEMIVDPFCGGGATAIASLSMNRLFVGIDIDSSCIKQTAERIKELRG